MRFRAKKLADLQRLQEQAFAPVKFTDHRGHVAFDDALARINKGESPQRVFEDCDDWRLGSMREQHRAAFTYLALGFATRKRAQVRTEDGKQIPPLQLFHFAGHAFREIGQINRAADAYERSALADVVTDDGQLAAMHPLTMRSFAQSRMAYAETGAMDKADEMHCLEWDVRSLQATANPVLWLWRVTSRYGTSLRVWGRCVLGVVAFFALLYQLLQPSHLAAGHSWTDGASGLYFAVVNSFTIGLGDIAPTDKWGELALALNVVSMFALLAVGLTIAGQKVLGR